MTLMHNSAETTMRTFKYIASVDGHKKYQEMRCALCINECVIIATE